MESDEPLRPLHRSQKLGHGNRRSIRSKDRILLYDGVDRCIHLLFLFHVLDDRLDDDIAIGQVRTVRSALQSSASPVLLLGGNTTLIDRALRKLHQRFLNPGKPFVEIFLFDLEYRDVKSSHSANLRNAGSHQSTTQNTDFLNLHNCFLRSDKCCTSKVSSWRLRVHRCRRLAVIFDPPPQLIRETNGSQSAKNPNILIKEAPLATMS